MEAILSDFFGVVIQQPDIYSRIAEMVGREIEMVGPFYRQYEAGQLDRDTFWECLGIEDQGEMEEELIESFDLNPHFREVHSELREEYRTGMVSNADSFLVRSLMERFDLEDCFETVVISAEVEMVKPHPGIYRLVLEQLGVEPEETVFVDDRLANLEGADKLGMTTVLHQVNHERDDFEPDFEIKSLRELPGVMEELD